MGSELLFLTQVLVILVVPVALWHFVRLRQLIPLVCVQILVGIAFGPSLFGRVAPELYASIFNPGTLAPLSGISSIAVLLFGFITGLHFEASSVSGRGRSFALVSAASFAVPTSAGFLAGLWIASVFPEEVAPGIDPVEFATAIGICIGVTALPVLGAILGEMNLLGKRIGNLALGVAAVNDAVLWLVLGGLMTVVAGKGEGSTGLMISLVGTPIYLGAMVLVVRPLMRLVAPRLLRKGRLSERGLAATCAVALASAIASQALGLHYLFGAFVAGALMPHELRDPILQRLQLFTLGVLMPFFFMVTGIRTSIDLWSTTFLVMALVMVGIAVVGKIGGTAVAARLTGESWADALTLGSVVQAQGLTELVVLTALLDAGIISGNAFSALTLMALVTTLLAMPFARLFMREEHLGVPAGSSVAARSS